MSTRNRQLYSMQSLVLLRNVNQHSYRSMWTLCHVNVLLRVETDVLFQKSLIVGGRHRTMDIE